MSVTIYKEGLSIYIPEATTSPWPLGSLQAVGDGLGSVSVANRGKEDPSGNSFFEIAGVAFGDIVDDTGATYGADEASVVNALNALFSATGLAAPTITSSSTINTGTNVPINYELTGTGIVGVEWSGLPAGLAPSLANRRILTGAIGSPGTTVATVTVTNSIGSTQQSITFTATSSFANSKSVRLNSNDYVQFGSFTALNRAGNGSGSGDAWSISCWLKPSNNSNANQTVWFFGSTPLSSTPYMHLIYSGNSSRRLTFRYGSNNNRIQLQTNSTSVTALQWCHVLVTYDGGTTGSASGSVNSYYSRFHIYIDGALQAVTNSNNNFGWNGAVSAFINRIGRTSTGSNSRGCLVDELAIWDSDQSGNASSIYNGGSPGDLQSFTEAPSHWWRLGDGPSDAFPNLFDVIGGVAGQMFNMTASDIVSDVP